MVIKWPLVILRTTLDIFTPSQEDTHANMSRRSSARTLILDKKNKPKAMNPFGTHDELSNPEGLPHSPLEESDC